MDAASRHPEPVAQARLCPEAAGPHQESFEQVTQGQGCRWAVLRRKGELATREGESITGLCDSARPCWRAGFSSARGGLSPGHQPLRTRSLLSRCGARVSSLEHLREGFHVTFASPPREELTAIALPWPLGARLALVMACHVLLWEAKQVSVSPFSPVGHVPAPCHPALGAGLWVCCFLGDVPSCVLNVHHVLHVAQKAGHMALAC